MYNELNKANGGNVKFRSMKNNSNLEKVRRYMRNVKILILRRTLNNSMPCKHCVDLIKYYGIKKIYYSYDQGLVYERSTTIQTDHLSSKYVKQRWANNAKEHEENKKKNRFDTR